MVMALKVARRAVCVVTKFTITRLTGQSASVQAHRSGSSIWHDNTFLGNNSNTGNHTALPYYREINGVVAPALRSGGRRTAQNGWDKNDPHGLYLQWNSNEQYNDYREGRNFYYRNVYDAERLRRDAGAERSRRIGLLSSFGFYP